jgi:Raf kinase inhibitor-like YbhB/YbcL family protein
MYEPRHQGMKLGDEAKRCSGAASFSGTVRLRETRGARRPIRQLLRSKSEVAGGREGFSGIIPLDVMVSTLLSWTSLGAGLALIACGSDPDPASANGGTGGGTSGGTVGGTSGGTAAGMAGASGSSTTGGGGASTGGTTGSGGQPQAGGGAGGAGGGGAGGGGGTGGSIPFVLTSPAFEHSEQCTNDAKAMCPPTSFFPEANVMMSIGGQNMSPELNWGPGPAGTMSYVMCLHDTSNGNTHWCLWNIPPATTQLPANLPRQKMPAMPAGAEQDSFSGDDDGYMGPGAVGNVYQFRIFALSIGDYNPPDAQNRESVYDELEEDPDDVVLETSTLRGRSNPDGYN